MDIYLQANGAANEGSSGGVFDHREALLVAAGGGFDCSSRNNNLDPDQRRRRRTRRIYWHRPDKPQLILSCFLVGGGRMGGCERPTEDPFGTKIQRE